MTYSDYDLLSFLQDHSEWAGKIDKSPRQSCSLSLECAIQDLGEGNSNPLQCSCLENPRDGDSGGLRSMGSHSQTRLKRLSSSSSIPRISSQLLCVTEEALSNENSHALVPETSLRHLFFWELSKSKLAYFHQKWICYSRRCLNIGWRLGKNNRETSSTIEKIGLDDHFCSIQPCPPGSLPLKSS